MAAEPNIAGMARLLYLVAGAAVTKLGYVGRGPGLDTVDVARVGGASNSGSRLYSDTRPCTPGL